MSDPRECGSCSVCCEVAGIPELDKPAHTPCRFQTTTVGGCCSIYESDERPAVCATFLCAWLTGTGPDNGRPDGVGAMFSTNMSEAGKRIGFAVETEPDAIVSTARDMAVAFCRQYPMPLIVSQHGKATAGEWVVIHDSLRPKASAIIGNVVKHLAPDVTMYERVEPTGRAG